MAGIQSIRNGLDGYVVKFIVAFIIIAFVGSIGWSVFFSSSDANVIASVDDFDLQVNDLTFEMQTQNYYLKQRFSDQDFEIEDNILAELSLESLLRKASILSFIENSGSVITDRIAYKQLATDENYQDNGKFSIERFESISRSQGFIPSVYLRRIKQDIALNFWRSGVSDTSFVTDKSMQTNLNLAEQSRDISYIRFNISEFIKNSSPSDEELVSFYDANEDQYQTEELAQLSFISLSTDGLKKGLSVDQKTIQNEYDLYLENFDNSTKRSVSHIMINVDESRNFEEAGVLALNIKQRINQGENFKDLVAEFSDDAGTLSSGGDLGVSDGSVFPSEFEEMLLTLKKGQVSEPVQLEESIHLLKLTQVQKPTPETFEEKSLSIEEDLLEDSAFAEYENLIDQAMDLTFTFNDLESIAEELNLVQEETPNFSRSLISSPLSYEAIKNLVFDNKEIQEGALSEVIEVSDNLAFIIQVSDFKPSTTKSFSEVKIKVDEALKSSMASSQLQSTVQEVLLKTTDGMNLESIAETNDINLTSYKSLARNSSLLPNTVIAQIFNMPRSAVKTGTDVANFENGDSIVYRLDAVNEKSSEVSQEEMEGFKAYMLSERSIAELGDLQNAAYKSANVVRKSIQTPQ